MAYVNYKNSPSEETPLTGGATGNLNIMQENGTSHGADTKLGYSQAFLNDHLVNISNEVDEDYRVNFVKSKNLFDANKVLNGMGIASGGTITSATDNGLFYIPVIVGNTYVFSFTDNGVSGNIVWGYTSQVPANGVSCTYNVMTNANLNGATFTPTGTQKYLCIRLNTTANNQYNAMSNIQCEEGSTATPYEAFVPSEIQVDGTKFTDTLNVGTSLDSRNRVNVLHSKNMLNKNVWSKNYINPINGEIIFSNNAALFNYIEVDPSTKYTISLNSTVKDYKVAYYTSSQTWISSSATITTTSTFTTPNNAKYIRVYINVDGNGIDQTKIDNLNCQVELGSTATSYEPYITPSINVDGEEIYSMPQVLWTNPSPSNTFASQNITLSSDDYNYFEIIYSVSNYTDYDYRKSSGIIPFETGKKVQLDGIDFVDAGLVGLRRIVTETSKTSFAISNNRLIRTSSSTDNNVYIIPLKIIGYK